MARLRSEVRLFVAWQSPRSASNDGSYQVGSSIAQTAALSAERDPSEGGQVATTIHRVMKVDLTAELGCTGI